MREVQRKSSQLGADKGEVGVQGQSDVPATGEKIYNKHSTTAVVRTMFSCGKHGEKSMPQARWSRPKEGLALEGQ